MIQNQPDLFGFIESRNSAGLLAESVHSMESGFAESRHSVTKSATESSHSAEPVGAPKAVTRREFLPKARTRSTDFIVIDLEPYGWRVYDGTQVHRVKEQDLLAGEIFRRFPARDLVVESAHLFRSTGVSKAQLFTLEELHQIEQLAKSGGIQIWAWPQAWTARACMEEFREHDRRRTPEAIHAHIQRYPRLPLKRWQPPTTAHLEKWRRRDSIREDMNLRLNAARYDDYENEDYLNLVRCLTQAWWRHPLYSQVSVHKLLENVFGVESPTRPIGSKGAVFSLYALVRREDGSSRRLGIGHMERIINPKGNGGVGRSNIMYHVERNRERAAGLDHHALEAAKQEDLPKLREARCVLRRELRMATRRLLQLFRDYDPRER